MEKGREAAAGVADEAARATTVTAETAVRSARRAAARAPPRENECSMPASQAGTAHGGQRGVVNLWRPGEEKREIRV
ncbi:hypothetical protein CFRA_07430 [Corynebacterium frankenforstense DSM 45800]|uniref:Uncharacterized protein n=1 Tax=Corynebacterium frankenforstense DSM 45800 TaxID=1437875 RepID=A0A1L7CTF8_9CORY|nr:hypothetical protein CFRA_07430 [Corynebacterium frankenforstense DSM 45800]